MENRDGRCKGEGSRMVLAGPVGKMRGNTRKGDYYAVRADMYAATSPASRSKHEPECGRDIQNSADADAPGHVQISMRHHQMSGQTVAVRRLKQMVQRAGFCLCLPALVLLPPTVLIKALPPR